MDSKQIRERGQFGSKRNANSTKIKTKRVLDLFDMSTTSRVKPNDRLRQDTVAEFRDTLAKLQALRNHKEYVYEKDFRDTIDLVNKKIGDKLDPIQERRLRTLFLAPQGPPKKEIQESSRLARLHIRLQDDSSDKPYKPQYERDKESAPDNSLEKIRQQREKRFARFAKQKDDKQMPPNLPLVR